MISVTSPYQVICERPLPREIKSLTNMPPRERERVEYKIQLITINRITGV